MRSATKIAKSVLGLYQRRRLLQSVPKGGVCAEIGVWKGGFSKQILRVTEPTKLHLIDPWKFETDERYDGAFYGGKLRLNQRCMDQIHESVLERFRTEIDAGIVRVHRQTSSEAAANFPDCYFDWVYIDGNHLYEYVKQDLFAYLPKVKVGGLITGDDYALEGWWEGGVKKAVDEFVSSNMVTVQTIFGNQFIVRRD
jgi:hypothetical protein